MLMRIFIALIVLTAIVIGALVLFVPRDTLIKIMVFRDFFDVAIPILGFGALVKYLCSCCANCCKCKACTTN
jgi:hypothetical protein